MRATARHCAAGPGASGPLDDDSFVMSHAQKVADEMEFTAQTSARIRLPAVADTLAVDIRRIFAQFLARPNLGNGYSAAPTAVSKAAGRKEVTIVQPTEAEDVAFFELFRLSANRRINLVPKRTLTWAFWNIWWNAVMGLRNAATSLVVFPARGIFRRGAVRGIVPGVATGAFYAASFLAIALVASPVVHLGFGVRNNLAALYNTIFSTLIFEPSCGKFIRANVAENIVLEEVLRRETRRIIAVGRAEFEVKRRATERRYKASTGKTLSARLREEMAQAQAASGGGQMPAGAPEEPDYYEILQLKRSASAAEVRGAYRRLAQVYHPDRNPDDPEGASRRFQEIQTAYHVLGDAKLRRAYDLGGMKSVGQMSRGALDLLSGTPQEVIQRMFGGVPFQVAILGPSFRSPWHMRMQHMCCLRLHELEILQSMRMRLLSIGLAQILDVHAKAHEAPVAVNRKSTSPGARGGRVGYGSGAAPPSIPEPLQRLAADAGFSPDFVQRCDRFVAGLAKCSFGPELLREIGLIYDVNARRYLREAWPWSPKILQFSRTCTGMDCTIQLMRAKDERTKQLITIFDMEWENLMIDFHPVVRFAALSAVYDVWIELEEVHLPGADAKAPVELRRRTKAEAREVRTRRALALKFLGGLMIHRGVPWGQRPREDCLEQFRRFAASEHNNKPLPPF